MSRITKRKYVVQEVMEYVLPSENQQIVKVTAGRGNNLHEVIDAKNQTFLVSMPCKFRKNIWVKRGSFIIIDPIEEGNKVKGEIANILLQAQIQYIQEQGLWPETFGQREAKSTNYIDEDMMPPSDSDDEDLASRVWNANKGSQLYEDQSSDEEESEEEDEVDDDNEEEEEEEEGEEDVQEEAGGSEEKSQS
ncbi:putative RNA-binding protein EIF1AD [Babylonia areolata]|uniref:putative RNA-binding protein EIF1AD n=1 Tax=Babylonia areolata TaxID=304850 RepID=UPI003FCF8FB7